MLSIRPKGPALSRQHPGGWQGQLFGQWHRLTLPAELLRWAIKFVKEYQMLVDREPGTHGDPQYLE